MLEISTYEQAERASIRPHHDYNGDDAVVQMAGANADIARTVAEAARVIHTGSPSDPSAQFGQIFHPHRAVNRAQARALLGLTLDGEPVYKGDAATLGKQFVSIKNAHTSVDIKVLGAKLGIAPADFDNFKKVVEQLRTGTPRPQSLAGAPRHPHETAHDALHWMPLTEALNTLQAEIGGETRATAYIERSALQGIIAAPGETFNIRRSIAIEFTPTEAAA